MALGRPGDAISRRLLEALRLEIRYDHTAHMATCELTLTGETPKHAGRSSSARLYANAAWPWDCRRSNSPPVPI